jgi:RNA polymerase sigma-70 factor (ECF subfamily)
MEDFEVIYTEYYQRIFAFLFKMCQDRDLSEELTQESFYQALKSFHRYDGSCSLFTWLAAIAKNTYFKHLRKASQRQNDLFGPDEMTLSATEEDDPAELLQKRAEIEALRRIVDRLPDKYKDVVVLRIYGDLPFSEIAKFLKISENSAKVLFYRAKNQIREELSHDNFL